MQSKAQIDQILRQKCEAKEIPGVVAMAATGNEVIYQGAFGKRDLSKDDPMTADSVFWIASMTKAITTAAGMQLVEQGKLSLDEPIGKLLPDLASPQVLEGFDADGEPKLRPAKKPITLRHLMTHTAGFAYDMWNGDIGEISGEDRHARHHHLPERRAEDAAHDRSRHALGIRHQYRLRRQGGGSGQRQEARRLSARPHLRAARHERHRLQDHATRMRQRLVGMHARGEDGALAPIPFELEQSPEFHMGGGGLYGTAADYIKFTQMILNKGTRQRQPGAEAGDRRDDGPEPHRRPQHGQDDHGAAAATPTTSISIPTWSRSGA